jgi:hypothetical protein
MKQIKKTKEAVAHTLTRRASQLKLSDKFEFFRLGGQGGDGHLHSEIELARSLLDAVAADAFNAWGGMSFDRSQADFEAYGQPIRTMNLQLLELVLQKPTAALEKYGRFLRTMGGQTAHRK